MHCGYPNEWWWLYITHGTLEWKDLNYLMGFTSSYREYLSYEENKKSCNFKNVLNFNKPCIPTKPQILFLYIPFFVNHAGGHLCIQLTCHSISGSVTNLIRSSNFHGRRHHRYKFCLEFESHRRGNLLWKKCNL